MPKISNGETILPAASTMQHYLYSEINLKIVFSIHLFHRDSLGNRYSVTSNHVPLQKLGGSIPKDYHSIHILNFTFLFIPYSNPQHSRKDRMRFSLPLYIAVTFTKSSCPNCQILGYSASKPAIVVVFSKTFDT